MYWTNTEQTEVVEVDSDDLAKELEKKSNELLSDGFEIFSLLPISSGNIVNGSGYYHTESVIITARK
jgi:hypothetical protein